MDNLILENEETIEDLDLKGYKIIQKKSGFRFGIDAVLLSDFAEIQSKDRVIDLGTGTGVIPILLFGKYNPFQIYGLEIQKKFADMAKRSVKLNGLDNNIKIIEGDIKDLKLIDKLGLFDSITVNPPYKKTNSGIISKDKSLAIARHEILINLEEILKSSKKLLKDGGKLFMINRPERLADIFEAFRLYDIEPKKVRFIYPNPDKKPTMVLIEGVKFGKSFLEFEKPLFVYDNKGNYSDEIRRIYGDDRRWVNYILYQHLSEI